MAETELRKPAWIKFKIPGGQNYTKIKRILSGKNLHTVCTEALCPNIGECFGCGTATFIILGNICTRNCLYCSVIKGIPEQPDQSEPLNIAEAVKEMSLTHAVITSVTRDDLPDGGASLFCETVMNIKNLNPACSVEVLVPDFQNNMISSIDKIISSSPDIINHNIEVSKNLYEKLRPLGSYEKSLELISYVSKKGLKVKSGLMIGFGEDIEDILSTLKDLYQTGCSFVTIGQYLKSLKTNHPVKKYYTPDEFIEIREIALKIGFEKVMSGPLVRSSYHAKEMAGIF